VTGQAMHLALTLCAQWPSQMSLFAARDAHRRALQRLPVHNMFYSTLFTASRVHVRALLTTAIAARRCTRWRRAGPPRWREVPARALARVRARSTPCLAANESKRAPSFGRTLAPSHAHSVTGEAPSRCVISGSLGAMGKSVGSVGSPWRPGAASPDEDWARSYPAAETHSYQSHSPRRLVPM
jgi:hypothetical protein